MRGLLLALIGAASGAAAGMGLGGGTLLIPALTLLFGLGQRQAQGVNMFCFLPSAAAALFIHARAGRLNFRACLPVVLGGAAGAALGALASGLIGGELLKKGFGYFLTILSIIQLGKTAKKGKFDRN